jgi:hypothetical protein
LLVGSIRNMVKYEFSCIVNALEQLAFTPANKEGSAVNPFY